MKVDCLIVIHIQFHTFNLLCRNEIMTTARVHDEPLVTFLHRDSDAHDVSSLAIATCNMLDIVLNKDFPCWFILFIIIDLHPNVQSRSHDNEYFIDVLIVSSFIHENSHSFTTTDS